MTYPRLLKASGACPPEDVSGAPGYEEFLVALADPDHEQHEDMVRWSGGSFDPKDACSDSIVERFDRLAKRWAPRPAKPKAPKGAPEHPCRCLRRMVTDVVTAGAENSEDRIADPALEGAPGQSTIRFHVPNFGLNGASSFEELRQHRGRGRINSDALRGITALFRAD